MKQCRSCAIATNGDRLCCTLVSFGRRSSRVEQHYDLGWLSLQPNSNASGSRGWRRRMRRWRWRWRRWWWRWCYGCKPVGRNRSHLPNFPKQRHTVEDGSDVDHDDAVTSRLWLVRVQTLLNARQHVVHVRSQAGTDTEKLNQFRKKGGKKRKERRKEDYQKPKKPKKPKKQ